MRVGVVRTQVPFVTGGAERHSANLCQALERSGHQAVEITLPFKWYPGTALANSVLAAKLTDLSEFEGVPIDLMIGLKFPAYLAQHPNRKFWIIHQHRQAYDQWDAGTSDLLHDPDGLALRHLVQQEDKALFTSSKDPVYANSKNVAGRLQKYLGVEAQSLYHPPPGAELLRCDSYSDYLFAPGRLNRSKRLELTLQALAATRPPLKLVIAGAAENPAYLQELQQLTDHLGIRDRVEWLGAVSDDTMRHHYSNARAVVFVPQDEDYGYVTLEAMLSAKATITVTDAGGPLEFIRNGKEGLICPPDPRALAAAFEQVMQDKDLAERLGQTALRTYRRMNISWDHVVETLTGISPVVPATPPAEAPLKITSVTPAPSENEPPAPAAAAQLKLAITPPARTVALPFETVTDVLAAYEFDTLAAVKGLEAAHIDIGLANYLGTHWQRYLTTLELAEKIKPARVLDIGVFPPLVFEALLANALPGVKLAGVWEGPEPYYQHVKCRDGKLPDFEIELAPANIERDRLPFED
uniref:glycosyltransferase family 4 protein n=1 Tax=Candidatus Halocynthiibacter alkanivorans TaxID=2267619 RepID=UPI000DF1F040